MVGNPPILSLKFLMMIFHFWSIPREWKLIAMDYQIHFIIHFGGLKVKRDSHKPYHRNFTYQVLLIKMQLQKHLFI